MTFEYRRMSESDQTLYGSWNTNKPYFGNWLADDERKFYLINFGGRGEHPDVQNYEPDSLLFHYKGENIYFEGRYKSETVIEKERWRTNWTIEIKLPASFRNEIDTIIKLIEEAFTCQENAWDPIFAGKIEIRVVADSIKFLD